METFVKKMVIGILAACARLTVRIKKPFVIGVTGSVGKTTTKEAIAAALSPYFKLGKSEGNFNSEYGLPCEICGMKWSTNLFVWLRNFFFAWPKKFFSYPKVLVLEMGSDKPGDIAHLTSIVKPNIAVICAIGVAHLEKFGTSERLFQEKTTLFKSLSPDGVAVANLDDRGARKAFELHMGKKISYGIEQQADVRAVNIKSRGAKTRFSICAKGDIDEVEIPFLGRPAILAALAAYAVGVSLGLSLKKISRGLENWQKTCGRMNIYNVGKICVLDDSYNANPQSMKAALETLRQIRSSRRWAVLGDMLELGAAEHLGHMSCAKEAVKSADKVVLVGERFLKTLKLLPKKKVQWFPGSESAAAKLVKEVKPGEAVLVKGSKKMQMNKIIDVLKETYA